MLDLTRTFDYARLIAEEKNISPISKSRRT